jgi:hypothetical protein
MCGDSNLGYGVGCYPQCPAGPVQEEPTFACACGYNATKLCVFEEPAGWCNKDAHGTGGACVDQCSNDPPGMAKSGFVTKACGCADWRTVMPPQTAHLDLCVAGRWCQEPGEMGGDGQCLSACAKSGIVTSECPCGVAATSLCPSGSTCNIANSSCTP